MKIGSNDKWKMENDKWKMIRSPRNLGLLALTAGVPRIVGALFVHKEPFGDAYCYIEQVTMMRGKIVTGYLAIENLYGFWLPLYQFFCSIVSVPVNHPVYVSRLVAAVAGTGVCALVYVFSYVLTSNQRISLAAFLAIAFNPFHLEYSFSAMTDIPHALLVMLCLYFVITDRWKLAALMGAAACLIRLESWMLILLVPAIQVMRRRTWPVLTALILSTGPAIWLFICWKTTGDPLASFHAHNQYMAARLIAHPEFTRLTLDRLWIDANRIAYSLNIAVLVGCLAALWLLFRDWRKSAGLSEWLKVNNPLVCALFFFAYFGFIVFTYVTKNNTDIWPRYGLILFSLGLPLLAYVAQQIFRGRAALAQAALIIAMLIGFVQLKTQVEDLARFVTQKTRPETIANYLRQEYAADPSIRVFCDSPEVRVMSGIPGDHFYHSFFDGIPKDREGFVGFLRTNGIKFLMIPEEDETSTPSQLFSPGQARDTGVFEGVIPPPDDRRADSLYRIRDKKPPPG
jgi:hypothetical protein